MTANVIALQWVKIDHTEKTMMCDAQQFLAMCFKVRLPMLNDFFKMLVSTLTPSPSPPPIQRQHCLGT